MRSDEQILAYEGRLADLADALREREMTAREIRDAMGVTRATAYAWVAALELRGVPVEHEVREVPTVTGSRRARVYRVNGARRQS